MAKYSQKISDLAEIWCSGTLNRAEQFEEDRVKYKSSSTSQSSSTESD
jgi:hypothetical protein